MGFYDDKTEPFILESARVFFKEARVNIISHKEANLFKVDECFTSIKIGNNYIAIPRKENTNIPIPYDPLCHDEYIINETTIEYIVESHVNKMFSRTKYLFSGRPDIYVGLKFEYFSYEILRNIYSGHLTTPFILLDESKDRMIFFEFDLEINTFSRKNELTSENLGGMSRNFWIGYFNQNFLRSISENDNHVKIINEYYKPVIEGLKIRD